MIISRTPFRISFFGGGTDYPAWYREHPGAVLATAIDKYCYMSCRWLPPFFNYTSRLVWSKIELVKEISEITHPAIRATLEFLDIRKGIELHHHGDLPARTGLGSSSAFSVALLHSLYGLKGIMPSKRQLAQEAIFVEQELLKENVGCQDQVTVAFGGLNRIDFSRDDTFQVSPIILDPERLSQLQDHLMLWFTGISRSASEIAGEQIRALPMKEQEIGAMRQMVDEAVRILERDDDLGNFGKLLHESWRLKRSLTRRISSPLIDQVYETALRSGAMGGKLLGAGGGGFLLLFVRPEEQGKVTEALRDLLHVPFAFEKLGSRIILYEPDGEGAPSRVRDRKGASKVELGTGRNKF
ncbi:MAG: kinase [Candidatus Omnitrophica bacterium]|nr:kinase [Candidatus Omnitrophota bacterium]